MKTLIRRSKKAQTGYEIVTIDDQGKQATILIDKTYPNEPYTLVLPENPSNRKYFNSKKVEAANGEIELTYKATRVLGERGTSAPRKPLEDYLEGEEREQYLALKAKAEKARDEQRHHKLTALEKAQREVDRAVKKLEQIEKEEAAK